MVPAVDQTPPQGLRVGAGGPPSVGHGRSGKVGPGGSADTQEPEPPPKGAAPEGSSLPHAARSRSLSSRPYHGGSVAANLWRSHYGRRHAQVAGVRASS